MKSIIPIVAFLALLSCSPSTQSAAPANLEPTIQDAVRSMVEATNKGDVSTVMQSYSRRPEVSSITEGVIMRGWEAIRQDADSLIGKEGQYKLSVGVIDVTALGADHALAVAAISVKLIGEKGEMDLPGAMSLVFEKSGDTWKLLHDHESFKIPGTD